MWAMLSDWANQFRTAQPLVHPQSALTILYLIAMWFYFRKERSAMALLPFLGAAMFLAPIFLFD